MNRAPMLFQCVVLLAVMALPTTLVGQATDHSAGNDVLQRELTSLRAQVAKLEMALAREHTDPAAPATGSAHGSGTSSMGGMGGMGGMSGMGGMKMMGRMRDDRTPVVHSNLPGFPGISHLYHVGAGGHFLDHADHLELTASQRRDLAAIHEEDLLSAAESDRQIESAEQELWVLTSKDQPDAAAIEAQIRMIADLEVERRLQFIRGVGRAADILTDVQRQRLVGDPSKPPSPDDAPAHQH